MREILFKGKTCNGKWAQGLLAIKDNKYYISNKAGMPFAYEVRPETVGQFTGLTDKNGVKIFEGDILQHFQFPKEPEIYDIGKVYWNALLCEWRRTSEDTETCRGYKIDVTCMYEVIGNIHDTEGGAE